MATMTLGVEGASLVLQIRNKNYILTASDLKISTGGSLPRELKPIKFKYQEPFDTAIDIGTLEDVLKEIQTLLTTPPPLPPAPQPPPIQPFLTQWNSIAQQLKDAPVLGGAITTVTQTNVRIVEIGLELTKQPDPPNTTNPPATYKGKFSLGLTFAPNAEHPPRLFNIQVVAFGAVLSVELEGTIGNLGTPRPSQ